MMRVLVADDDPINRRLAAAVFGGAEFEVVLAVDGEAALEVVRAHRPDVVILDLHMPGLGGVETLQRIGELFPDLPVVMLTSHGDVASAVQATKLGAFDFLVRPIHHEQLVATVRRAVERRALQTEVKGLRRRLAAGGSLARLASLPSMQAVVEQIERVSGTPLTVLVSGETGTGKELVARAIHQESARRDEAFVAVDCGALPENLLEAELFGHERGAFSGADRKKEGRFALAERGTLFLDEIGNLSASAQAKLLRAVQEREVTPLGGRPQRVDVRLLAATNERLDELVRSGRFREDLYYRLAEFSIALAPLRERCTDIPGLLSTFLDEAILDLGCAPHGLSDEARDALVGHSWPGNVRELRNVVRRAALSARGPKIELADVRGLFTDVRDAAPGSLASPASTEVLASFEGGSLKEIAERAASEAERCAILAALRASKGNRAEASRRLQIDQKTLRAKLRRLGVEDDR